MRGPISRSLANFVITLVGVFVCGGALAQDFSGNLNVDLSANPQPAASSTGTSTSWNPNIKVDLCPGCPGIPQYVAPTPPPDSDEHTASDGHLDHDMPQCGSAFRKAQIACNAQQFSPQVTRLINSFRASSQAGNIRDACKNARQVAAISGASSMAFADQCRRAAKTCARTCRNVEQHFHDNQFARALDDDYDKKASTCEEYTTMWMGGFAQALQDAATVAESSNCIRAASMANNDCEGSAAYSNPLCPQYCLSPTNQGKDICNPDICRNPANTNTLMCFCRANPTDGRCAGGPQNPNGLNARTGLGTTPGRSGLGTTPDFNFSGEEGDPQDYDGNPGEANVQAAGVNYDGQSGGGIGGGGGGLAGGMGGGGGQKEEGPYNTDILKGTSSASGGAVTYGGSGGGGGYAAGGRGGSGKNDDGFDWRKYMPKMGDKGARRPASVSAAMFDNGITAANGLSNFEKITRKMNEKRAHLLP